jgi:hypothetical protein
MVIVMEQAALSARRRGFITARAGIHSREGGILMDVPRRGRVCIPMLPFVPSIGMN